MLHMQKKFAKDNRKVRDHCHYTGKYRGTGHGICNPRFNVPNEILVVFHYGSNKLRLSFYHKRISKLV